MFWETFQQWELGVVCSFLHQLSISSKASGTWAVSSKEPLNAELAASCKQQFQERAVSSATFKSWYLQLCVMHKL